jgi:SOS-response transcriptional repressor LexA
LEPAGIIAGDSVIIERGRTPRAGEFALVTIDGELMLRRISREGALVLVEGSTAGIYPQHEVMVHGTATFVLRHLSRN